MGTEGFAEHSPIPRVIWVVVNGFMYKCSPECLRPVTEDEVAFRQVAQEFSSGHLPDELEQTTPSRGGPAGRYFDLTQEPPQEEDFETGPGSDQEGDPLAPDPPEEPAPERNVRRRINHDDDGYWDHKSGAVSPRGSSVVRPAEEDCISQSAKLRRTEEPEPMHDAADLPGHSGGRGSTSPELRPEEMNLPEEVMSDDGDDGVPEEAMCCEIAFDVFQTDVVADDKFLWKVLEECATVDARPGQKRRVEVSFRKLSPSDRERFRKAMHKEWQSWLENKVTTIAKSKGVPKSRIIGSRWVLTWKKSSDPDVTAVTPKARLVLVGFQDPDLGKIATDSPTLRKESKHIILSICASKKWLIWGADIKTAFLSGDASNCGLFFRPPQEIREFMQLDSEDVLRLEKAAYGLAEAPRAWCLRLSRELVAVGLVVSQLDPCVFLLRDSTSNDLLGVCGVHVDDLLGGGSEAMDKCLQQLRQKLPFGDFRTSSIKYTGAEIRQEKDFTIEVTQEAYIDKLEEVSTKPFGKPSSYLPDPSLMRACCGQLAWVANHTRPDQAFLASFLQGTQDQARVLHLTMFNKAV